MTPQEFLILVPERFRRSFERANFSEDCWTMRANSGQGYVQIRRSQKTFIAHRLSYEFVFGQIEQAKQIDHLCRTRNCFRPQHLEAVTLKVNVLRGFGIAAQCARKTHCPRGHALSNGNLVKHELRRGYRRCLKCERQRKRRDGPL